jgi:hypothetical protein
MASRARSSTVSRHQANSGGRQTLTFDSMEFVGYGIVSLPNATSNISYNDFAGRDVKSKAIFWMNGTPTVLAQGRRAGAAAPVATEPTMRFRR